MSMLNLPDDLRELQLGRENIYGEWDVNMETTSQQMAALAHQYTCAQNGQDFPIWWCPLMMVVVKLNRIASGNYHEDNFKDLRVYLSFVEEMQKQEAQKND